VVEPWTGASFPLSPTDHAKLGIATAEEIVSNVSMPRTGAIDSNERRLLPSHVVATLLEFNRCLAIETCLPASLLSNLRKPFRVLIFGT
jgi:hypothetical protein